ncbi:MAG TPA: ADOP family duplicated permease [Gemmatimonadaceae bacterium]|nr:ADOP family duplicated permease [Gemmatimonadaceae bacterium]
MPDVPEPAPSRFSRWRDAFDQDAAYAARGLRLRPGFTATVVVTLALGIGANAAMFGILDRLLFRPPAHVVDADRVVQIHTHRLGSTGMQTSQSYALYKDLRAGVPEFESIGVTTPSAISTREYYPLGQGVNATRVAGAQVSPDFFTALGVRPALGRFFQEDEAGEQNPQRVAVIGYAFWQRHFGGARDVIGRTLDLGADRYTVVGVAPRGFTGAELSDLDVWIPIAAAESLRFIKGPQWSTTRNATWLHVYARLRPGATMERALARATATFRAAEVARISASSRPENAAARADSMRVAFGSVIPGRSPSGFGLSAASSEVRVARLLGAVSFLVLLLACANVANLLLVRSLNRRREIAVRLALGVTRRRLVAQHLIEGLMLAGLGALGALAVVQFGSGIIGRMLLVDAAWSGSAIDARLLVFTAVVAVTTGVLTALLPALQSSNPELTSALKAGVREGASSRSFTRSALLAAQAALALMLLVGSGLFVRSLQRVAALPLGVDIDRVLVADIEHTSAGLSNEAARDLYLRFMERARQVPGVTASAVSIAHSFGLGWGTRVYLGGRQLEMPQMGFSQYAITPDYFTVMGIRLVGGRAFTDGDGEGAERVAIINETAASTFWPAGDAVGSCIQVGADTMPCTTIVGVVTNARRQQLVEGPIPQIYRPLLQLPMETTNSTVSSFGYTLLARAAQRPAAVVESLRRVIQGTSPEVPYANVRPLRDQFGRHTRSWRLGANMFTVFGGLALVLAAIGLYSVVVFNMAQRVHEYGVRLALGATAGNLVRLTVLRGMGPVLVGVIAGAVIAVAAGGLVGGLLFQTSGRDPAVIASVVLLLLVVAVAASLIPGVRAAKADPMRALRAD